MFKPTLAVAAELDKIKFPVYASCKLDGIRCAVLNGTALTRTLKAVPNKHISAALSRPELSGLDGEIICGEPTDKLCYNLTNSAVMSHEGKPDATYYVFDLHNIGDRFFNRIQKLQEFVKQLSPEGIKIEVLEQRAIHTKEELLNYEEACLELGYEGLILRSYDSPYKFGRSTVKEGYMLKVKRFSDFESEVIGFTEEMENTNVAGLSETGNTKRSSHAEGLVPKGTLGSFKVRDLTTGVEFAIGTGLTAADRKNFWIKREELIGKIIKFKCFEIGRLTAPRFPVFLGFRDKIDM